VGYKHFCVECSSVLGIGGRKLRASLGGVLVSVPNLRFCHNLHLLLKKFWYQVRNIIIIQLQVMGLLFFTLTQVLSFSEASQCSRKFGKTPRYFVVDKNFINFCSFTLICSTLAKAIF
jgi:hypothetical protein